MVDINNTELEVGDLILFTPDKVIDTPGKLFVYHSMDTKTIRCGAEDNVEVITIDTLKYFPLSQEGLQVARHITNTPQTDSLYRTQEYKIPNICSENLLKMDPAMLNSTLSNFYTQIVALF